MLLSIDWDAFSGTRELVFDAPIWGTRDAPPDRLKAWRTRVYKRGGQDWQALAQDFPLYSGWQALGQYRGIPTWLALSHADAWAWLQQFPGSDVLNIDSHHDLASFSGDGSRLRPGNWAGLSLQAGLIRSYTCCYPPWHADLPVAEGFDLNRTQAELIPLLPADLLERTALVNSLCLPAVAEVRSILLVQSPAWTNPAHDREFWQLSRQLQAAILTSPLERPWQGQ